MSGEIRKQIRIFAIILGTIVACMVVLCISVVHFNSQERELYYSAANAEEDNTNKHCSVTIKPRGGSTDTWIKRVMEKNEDGITEEVQYAGIIYDIMVTNQTNLTIRDWTLKIPVPQDSYLNNAWCGELEIHQHEDGKDSVQALDLRKCIEQKVEINLKHAVVGTDLMIPVNKGDYFVYLPSVEVKEDFITPSDLRMEEYQSKRVDFIAYHKTVNEDMTPMEFPDAVLYYHLHKELLKLPTFWILITAFMIWCICLLIVIIVNIKTRRLREKMQGDAKIIEQAMSAFMGFIDAKDTTTNGHSMRVAKYAKKLAKRLGFSDEECDRIYYIGLMHDCGKIGIPDAILNKPDKLTEEEYEIIKTHTLQGNRILKNFTSIEGIRDGALYHHERYDGKGYPQGLKGEEIPFIARIICVADSFDVMNSERCYQHKMTKEDILEQLEINKGAQFDPEIVDCFLAMIADGTIEF